MFGGIVDVLILTAIALFVLSRLYIALGRDEGAQTRHPDPSGFEKKEAAAKPAQTEPIIKDKSSHPAFQPTFAGPGAAGLETIYNADKSFDPAEFLRGAKSAYAMIVAAFAAGDRDTLRPLLDDDVYEAWDDAITARETDGASAYELLRLKSAQIDDAHLSGNTARVMMRYEAELGDGEHVRRAREIWTFMRDVTSGDPNWILDDVESAN